MKQKLMMIEMPECGFMVQSHDEKELIDMAKQHVKKMHKMNLTDREAKEMICEC